MAGIHSSAATEKKHTGVSGEDEGYDAVTLITRERQRAKGVFFLVVYCHVCHVFY